MKQKTSNYPKIPFNFHFSQCGGGGGAKNIRLSESKYAFFGVSDTATLLSKYGTAEPETWIL